MDNIHQLLLSDFSLKIDYKLYSELRSKLCTELDSELYLELQREINSMIDE